MPVWRGTANGCGTGGVTRLHWILPGETESASAGEQPGKGWPGQGGKSVPLALADRSAGADVLIPETHTILFALKCLKNACHPSQPHPTTHRFWRGGSNLFGISILGFRISRFGCGRSPR